MDLQLQDKSAFVTGSTAGIGFAIAERLASESARVIVNGRTAQRVDAALKKLSRFGARVERLPADLGTAAGVAEAIRRGPGHSGEQSRHI
jgi:NAD(P)-dependent dehydrogenase (short-subunit alcohol dehydrogenase family)